MSEQHETATHRVVVVMPGIDGRELGRRLLALRAELRGVVYISGYAPRVVDGLESLGEHALFLRKPFTVAECRDFLSWLLND